MQTSFLFSNLFEFIIFGARFFGSRIKNKQLIQLNNNNNKNNNNNGLRTFQETFDFQSFENFYQMN